MKKKSKMHFLIIDDDKLIAQIHQGLLEDSGHQVTLIHSSKDALRQIPLLQPDVVLCDLMMPEMDGYDLIQSIQNLDLDKKPILIVISGKVFDFDRARAFELGASGYLTKPVNPKTFAEDLLEMIHRQMTIQFWGTRGTLPVPGEKTVKYGGNTNCVTLSFAKKYFFIFDAGTGIKSLSNYLVKYNVFPIDAKIFISHPHYDHINGLPFFVPMYVHGNEFEILGTNQGDKTIEKLIAGQMDCVYFPITIKELSANLKFRNISEESFNIGELHIDTIMLNHPGKCLGYRVKYEDKIFCYITDNELYLENSPHYNQYEVDRLINFIKSADLLVIDSTYTDEEYAHKEGWGHSCVSRVVDVADKANVKTLCLYHHDPDEFDNEIDNKLKHAIALLKARHSKTRCFVAREGEKFII